MMKYAFLFGLLSILVSTNSWSDGCPDMSQVAKQNCGWLPWPWKKCQVTTQAVTGWTFTFVDHQHEFCNGLRPGKMVLDYTGKPISCDYECWDPRIGVAYFIALSITRD